MAEKFFIIAGINIIGALRLMKQAYYEFSHLAGELCVLFGKLMLGEGDGAREGGSERAQQRGRRRKAE